MELNNSSRQHDDFPFSNVNAFLEAIDLPSKGRSVIAKKPFHKNDIVLFFLGHKVHVSELNDLTHALQIAQHFFLSPSGHIDDFVNHSCNPNTGIRNDDSGNVVLFALRDIALGEEITFDYATTQSEGYSTMKCQCGEPNCRELIGDFRELSTEKQQYYLNLGAVLDYLTNFSTSEKSEN